jgi:hypothetical protein
MDVGVRLLAQERNGEQDGQDEEDAAHANSCMIRKGQMHDDGVAKSAVEQFYSLVM